MKLYILLMLCVFVTPAIGQDIDPQESITYRVLEKNNYFSSYDELMDAAELVVVGTVGQKTIRRKYTASERGLEQDELAARDELYERNGTLQIFSDFVTDSHIAINTILKGDIDDQNIEVTQWGGLTPYGKYRLIGTGQLRPGTTVLLFLNKRKDVALQRTPTWHVVGKNDGYLVVKSDESNGSCLVRKPIGSSSSVIATNSPKFKDVLVGIACEFIE